MRKNSYKVILKCSLVIPIIWLLDFCGILTHLVEKDFGEHFYYPLQNDNRTATAALQSVSAYRFLHMPSFTLAAGNDRDNPPRLTIFIKSAIPNKKRREIIRNTWGYEARFSDVHIRRAFLLGVPPTTAASDDNRTNDDIVKEVKQYGDIVQGDFVDAYFNNTIKTMMGIRWTNEHFNTSDFYMFVDDDYYVSVKNVLRFLGKARRTHHENLLFAGYVFHSSPLRHKFSKWYVSLEEYPFDKWPPYVTAGAFILSRAALLHIYAVSQRVPLFRFDDIYLGIVAYKAGVSLHHCDGFYFHRPRYYGPDSYGNVIATHGFDDPDEMSRIWNECRSANYA